MKPAGRVKVVRYVVVVLGPVVTPELVSGPIHLLVPTGFPQYGFLATTTAADVLAWPATNTETGLTPEASGIESAKAGGVATTTRASTERTAARIGRAAAKHGPDDCMTPFYQTSTPLDSHRSRK